MELYKEQRKNRKKNAKTTVSVSSDESNSNKNSTTTGDGNANPPADADAEPPEPAPPAPSSSKKKNKKKKKQQLQRQMSASSTDDNPPNNNNNNNNNNNETSNGTDSLESSKHQPPPGFHLPSMELWNDENTSSPPKESNKTPQTERDKPKQQFENEEEHRLAPSSTSRYVLIPERDRPPHGKEATSLAVAAAKAFVDLYYPHITHGLSSDLAMHYTPHAQKSVSVGGAHSVVQGRNSIAVQIASLSGSVFVVRGVVSQDTVEGLGAHVLVTGIMLPQQQQQHQHQTTPFCHSISLVPAKNPDSGQTIPYAFQVHNDALSLLSGDMIAAAVNPQQPPQQPPPQQRQQQQQQQQQQQPQEHHHPPESFSTSHMHQHHYQQTMKQPPGLFG